MVLKKYEDFKIDETVVYGSRATSASVNVAPLFLKKELNSLYNYTKMRFSENPLEWDSRETYSTGDYVWHEGVVYVAIRDNGNQEPGAASVSWSTFQTSTLDLDLKYVTLGANNYITLYDRSGYKAMKSASDATLAMMSPINGFVPYDNGVSSYLGTSAMKWLGVYAVNATFTNTLSTNITATAITTGTLNATSCTADNFYGVSSSAKYADLAERYESDTEIEPGTIVGIGGSAEITVYKAGLNIAGVISTNPAFKMNDCYEDVKLKPFVALKGKIPCKVTGNVIKGQYVVASDDVPGFGYGVTDLTFELSKKMVGIALENSVDGVVNIKV